MSMFSAIDHQHMATALRLAARGLYSTAPNPRVGCLIAHAEKVVGSGWHQRVGQAHAEVHALREAGPSARGATVYVTLEPCAHHGRTPPCAQALIAADVARVVIAVEDPFPAVAGQGAKLLSEAGIRVETGLLREQARALNAGFFSRIERGRPFVRVKLAMSMDGRTALSNGKSTWITGEAARSDVQRWRARSSAILAGTGTVVKDNPRLSVRLTGIHDDVQTVVPMRVVLDRQLRIPAGYHVLDGSIPTLVLHAGGACCPDNRYARVECATVSEQRGTLDLQAVLKLLAARDVNELQVEAGPSLCGALFAEGLVDELLLYVAPLLLGDRARPLLCLPALTELTSCWKLHTMDLRMLGSDLRLRMRPEA